MALTKNNEYKARRALRPNDTPITSHKPLDNDMPSSPVPFITPSGLVTFHHDLKARISSLSLVKVPLTMRPMIKKRTSAGFSLSLKRHSTTIFFRPSSSSSSDTSGSADCTPTSELVDPMSMTEVVVDLPSQTPLQTTPSIGAKIMDRFWPEEEYCSEESCHVPVPSHYPAALAPPPHYRRAPRSLESVQDVPVCDRIPWRTSKAQNTGPLRFPF